MLEKLRLIRDKIARKADETKLPQVDIEVNEHEELPEDLVMF